MESELLFYLLPEKFLVRQLAEDPMTLVGFPVAAETESGGYFNISFITFVSGQHTRWIFDPVCQSVVEVVRVQAAFAGRPTAAGEFLLPPLAASEMARPASNSNFYVRVDNLLYLTNPRPVQTYEDPVAARSLDAIQGRSIYVRFCAAPVSNPDLRSHLNNALRSLNEVGQIEAIEYVDLGRGARIVFTNSSSAEALLNIFPTREILGSMAGKFLDLFNYQSWVETANQRCVFLTFDINDDEVTEAELYEFFNHSFPWLDSIRFQNVTTHEKPLHAYAYFFASSPAQYLLQHRPSFFVGNGKKVIAKPYKPQCERSVAQ